MRSDWANYAEAEYQQMLMADHQEAKLAGSDDDDDDEPDVVDEYTQSHGFDDTSPLVLSSQPFYETDEECIDHTYDHALLDNTDPTDETFQIDIGDSGRECPGDYLDVKAPSYYHSYYSYLSAGASDLGVKDDDINRGEQPSDLEEDESDSTPSTPVSSASKDEAPVLMDSKEEKRTPAAYATLETAIEGSSVWCLLWN